MSTEVPTTTQGIRIIRLTAAGRGAIATLRVEGPGAMAAVADRLRTRSGRPLAELPPDRPFVGRFSSQPGQDDPGEEVVVRRHSAEAIELHCHGGHAAVAMIEQTLVTAGGQVVPWQDWIAGQEADPIAAAARIALADARTDRTAAILWDQCQGALRRAIRAVETAVADGDMVSARRQAEALLARVPLGRHLTQPWQVVVAGAPNVGKSSLINALVGYKRAIVHSMPGTTRDLVTVQTAVDGWPVELCDTAGLRAGGNAVERAGIELARQRLATADLVLLVFDRGQPWSGVDQALLEAWPRALVVHNKGDLPAPPGPRPPGLVLSALGDEGIEELAATIAARLVPVPPPPGAAVPFTEEQAAQLAGWLSQENCKVEAEGDRPVFSAGGSQRIGPP
jgi:tRNA modification GTPase